MKPDIWWCPSFNDLACDGQEVERLNRLKSGGEQRVPYGTSLLEGRQGRAIAATDYSRAYPAQIQEFVPMRYTVLRTVGLGRSDTRENLRRHFDMSRYYVA